MRVCYLRAYSDRAKAKVKEKVKATSLRWTALTCKGTPTLSKSKSDIAFLITCEPIRAKAKAISLSFSVSIH